MASDSASMSTTKTLLTSLGSAAAAAMLVRTISKDLLPDEFTDYIYGQLLHFLNRFSRQITMVINEYNGLVANEIYEAAVIYLGSKASANRRLNISKPQKENSISVAVDRNGQVDDEFDGAKIKWVWVTQEVYNSTDYDNRRSEKRSFELHFHEKHKKRVLESYLPYVLKQAKTAKNLTKSLQIFTVDTHKLKYGEMSEAWIPVNLDHPSNFETLAMDSQLKKMIVNDLDRFVSRREFYRNVGKAWKRGYLLYGPPGTGKSSLIAAMANHLKFDVYDLELTAIKNNNCLRQLLLLTANRSILVVEDIDCTIQLHDRAENAETSFEDEKHKKSKVTLSGFLNFVDGLWSSCGDERIIIFTTNHREKLDPALLRPGRMDMHIHMSYCTTSGFRTLASNYLHIDDHKLFGVIEEQIKSIEVTPAEMAEQLLKSEGDVDVALSGILSFLHEKKMEKEEANTKKEETILLAKQGLVIEEDNQNIEDAKIL